MIGTVLTGAVLLKFGQLELHYWRRKISGLAALPVSNRVRAAAGVSTPEVEAQDFRSILSLHEHAPGLYGPGGDFRAVRAYYNVVGGLAKLIPSTAKWANAERTICARYAAVIVDQHLQRNAKLATQTPGFETAASAQSNAAMLASQ